MAGAGMVGAGVAGTEAGVQAGAGGRAGDGGHGRLYQAPIIIPTATTLITTNPLPITRRALTHRPHMSLRLSKQRPGAAPEGWAIEAAIAAAFYMLQFSPSKSLFARAKIAYS